MSQTVATSLCGEELTKATSPTKKYFPLCIIHTHDSFPGWPVGIKKSDIYIYIRFTQSFYIKQNENRDPVALLTACLLPAAL